MASFGTSKIPAVNVAMVPQRSPLRYPGGKTWLVPHIRHWLSDPTSNRVIVEPFAGGGIVSLTAIMEGLVDRVIMVDRDRDVSAFWRSALEQTDELIDRICHFTPTKARVERLERQAPRTVVDHGFRTLVMNRTRRGGVLAPGAALTKNGENGNGITSRWYPDTLTKRLRAISDCASRITFLEGNGMAVLELIADQSVCLFIDPPYTASGGKRAGSRLYAHHVVDHAKIFRILSESRADFLMTYDCSDDIKALVRDYGFQAAVVEMKNGHHARIPELIITRDRLFT